MPKASNPAPQLGEHLDLTLHSSLTAKPIPKGWREVRLGEVAEISTGKRNSQNANVGGEYPLFDRSQIVKRSNKFLYDTFAIIIPGEGKEFIPRFFRGKFDLHQRAYSIYDIRDANSFYLYYYLLVNKRYFKSVAVGSTVYSLRLRHFQNFPLLLPPLPEQEAIDEMLSSLDDQIELLHAQNKTLEELAQALFHHWFVEGRKEEWEEGRLGDFFPVVTGKKNANFSIKDGKYAFFTCGQSTLRAPSYSFEGKAILLAGNGNFNVKRYERKFEAYQRTYVLMPYKDKYSGFLYALVKFYIEEITKGAQGSVIDFITKPMIAGFRLLLPPTNFYGKLEQINQIYRRVDANTHHIRTLSNLRDTLLPQLMGGALRLPL